MSEEQRKEICKAFHIHQMTVKEIAEAFKIDAEEIGKAIAWGEQTRYTDELKERGV